ncbi:MAG: hypothetical protein A2493_00090 [Candidatus Magasanikbacteria bacterium RIFOXYC12_FULL_33_11]|uniref:Uncharacterized protein n=1 Tax=Candidatus Magasanikbacteria bacterium RIFOXYC12_FULL_33_11 TaxID=1798701 RepID=A0A1F6NQL9_9BACT|nr:MAG: hypothetical protein A2493_00090 [Candidatus Magasanikbacteria bacterium RIFOXYC12_FULL_33_11]
MATQGLITVMQDGQVLMKIVAGCHGYKAKAVATSIRKNWPVSIDDAYELAQKTGFGDEQSLVVISHEGYRAEGVEDLPYSYEETLDNPDFNPRWDSGMCDYLEIVNI